MHKSELEGMTLAELTALAGKLGAELSNDQTTLIYNILDAQSLQAPVEPKKKRGRKPKAKEEPAATQPEVEVTKPAEPEEVKVPKKRGRKSKAEKEAEEAAKAAKAEEAAKAAEQQEVSPRGRRRGAVGLLLSTSARTFVAKACSM